MDDQPAAIGAVSHKGAAAWLGAENTLPPFRRQGLQGRIIAAQLVVATALGASVQTAETAEPSSRGDATASSYRNQERAGFTHVYTRPNYRPG